MATMGDPKKPLLECKGYCELRNSVVFPNNRGQGMRMEGSGTGHIENNVFYRTYVGLLLGNRGIVVHNAMFDVQPGNCGIVFYSDIHTTSSGIVVKGGGGFNLVLKDNAVAGGPSVGISFIKGNRMHRNNWANNTVHSTDLGIIVKGALNGNPATDRGVLQSFVVWNVRDIGVWVYTSGNEPTIEGGIIANAKIGMLVTGLGPDPTEHLVSLNRINILNTGFIGRTRVNPICGDQTALKLPVIASKGGSITPGQCGPAGGGWHFGIYGPTHPVGSEPAIGGEVRVTGCSFLGYKSDSCGRATVLETLMMGAMNSSDAIPPLFFSRTTIDADSRTHLATLHPPLRQWITTTKCVAMDCDGPKHVIIHDLDGTLTGLGEDSSVLARAEFMHQMRADPTKCVLSFMRPPTQL